MEAAEAAQATQVACAHSDQQQDIFNSLGPYDYQNEPQFARNMNAVKVMARQQLAVSTDSPFSRQTSGEPSEEELREMKRQRAELLRRETEEIRRQLELVRGRLNELKLNENNKELDEKSSPTGHNQTPESKTSKANLQNNQLVDSKEERRKDASSPKLRPLTGKSDCPNCNCDRKKTSVCDYCIKFALVKPAPVLFSPDKHNNNHDDRPIRPMRRAEDHTKAEVVDEVVVPNRLYTISKSLDAKRTKLGEAIEDLQLMMERLKRREDKLEQDRKVAHLYRDQWKFGPTIGGPVASPRARLGKNPRQQPGSYQSRLDANLARDSRSLSGFQHIESAMRLRQYNQKPRPAPRNLQSRPINNHMRSKSLESVRTSPKSILSTRKAPMQRPPSARVRNELLAKSQSEVDLSRLSTAPQVAKMDHQSSRGDDDQDEDAIEENLEQEICETNDEDDNDSNSQQQVAANNAEHLQAEANSTDTSQRAPKTAWIPVFGETEVKTVKRVPTRKVQILDSNSTSRAQGGSKSAVADGRQTSATSGNRKGRLAAPRGPPAPDQLRRRATSNNSSQVMNEASRRIQFASNLLDDEHRDSRSRNQIIVNRHTPTPRARQSRGQSTSSSSTSCDRQPVMVDGDKANRSEAQSLIADATREISRLETMIGEQQKLLTQLASAPSSAHHDSCCRQPGHETRSSPTFRRSQLIHQLREKLNKTKARLSKTLGEEREKHEQLKQKVDLSLKKQSDLEGENELLKQSLSKCIDTCLRDISSTFESINETLTDSMVDLESGGREDPLKAAQLLEDNRHLKKMKSIIETTESQRRRIFDELKEEKQRSQLLEVQLEQSRRELDDLIQAKQRLELQLASVNSNQVVVVGGESQRQITVSETENHLDKGSSSQQWQQATETNNDDHLNTTSSTTEDSASYNSVEAYRQYIQALSPDLEAIKRERRLILGEFDNIKKMLSDMDR